MQDVLTLILGGGRGTRLYPLTKRRSEPAVPIAGKYRLIDIPISNCINSGLKRIYVLTQFLSVSLHRHISNTYKLDPFSRGFIEVLPAQQTNEAADWYQGTADAVRQNLRYLQDDGCRDVLVLSGDQLYHMNFRDFLRTHRENRAGLTIAVVPVTRAQAAGYGIARLDEHDRIVELVEKPVSGEQLDRLRVSPAWLERHGIKGDGREYLANMGIYLFHRELLLGLLSAQPKVTDFVTEVFAHRLSTDPIQAHLFHGYWEDVGSIKSYHAASLGLAGDQPPFDFHSPEGVIYTRMRNLPASSIRAARVEKCLVSDGCIIEAGTQIERCVIGVRSRIGRQVTLRDTVVIGADNYETEAERRRNRQQARPDLGIGDHSLIERAILDKDSRIGSYVRIINAGNRQNADGDNYVIRDGIVVIPNGAVVPDGTTI
jgi:glucose-1-phosphate adenylyltransferase